MSEQSMEQDIYIPIEVTDQTTGTESYNLLDGKEEPFTSVFAKLQSKNENTQYAIALKLNDFSLILDNKMISTEEYPILIDKNDTDIKVRVTLYTIQIGDIIKLSFKVDFIIPTENNCDINQTGTQNKEDVIVDLEYSLMNNIRNVFSKMNKRKCNITETNLFVNEGWVDQEALLLNSQIDPLILKLRFTCPGRKVEYCEEYNGLNNEGNTCYMNSIIQVLYHINLLKKLIYKLPLPEDNPVFAFQNIFYNLKCSDTKAIDLFTAMKMDKSEWNSQQDVQEMFSILLDLIGETYSKLMDENSFTDYLEGTIKTMIECPEVKYLSDRSENFLFLQLDIEYCKDLYQCIERYLSVEPLRDENQYDCEGILRDAIKYSVFEKLPKILLVQLKRFKYNECEMEKVHHAIEYPDEIDMSRYYALKMGKNGEIEYSNDLTYTLYAVVVHQGQINSGHYYVFIKDYRSQRWIKFNDKTVTYANAKEVFEQNYGGEFEEIVVKDQEIQVITKESDRSAYILVYVQKDHQHIIFDEVKDSDVSLVINIDTRSTCRAD
jgi:ubiquitin C-terminal hydrolase